MDKRHERMLEDLLKAPGNGEYSRRMSSTRPQAETADIPLDNCADCHTPHPRWASVNLGVFLCVSCASIHRKLGTHRSRV